MSNVKNWISAARLRTLPLAFSSIMTGAAIAIGRDAFDLKVFILCLSTTLCLQVLSNYANDLGDFLRGTDNDARLGPQRAIQSGVISTTQMQKAVILMSVLSLISGISLIYCSGLGFDGTGMFFLALGLLAILAAIKYTAGQNPYGYAGLGDISVFFFFGLLGVLGSYYLHDLSLPFSNDVFIASTIGFLSAAVLNLNNMRDAVPDKQNGKITMAVRLGHRNSRIYHFLLVSFGVICLLVHLRYGYSSPLDLLPLAIIPFLAMHLIRVLKNQKDCSLDPELKRVALSTFFLSLLLLIAELI
ncbi:MAG: 1,4-dihydroxy-2-naphthoate octaprenyltransferase [Flavobacteriales bacterium]|nr:1,4-dihydroxy-2-naphthoate octaprenyltransferase [Flavobacteriales bacterium]